MAMLTCKIDTGLDIREIEGIEEVKIIEGTSDAIRVYHDGDHEDFHSAKIERVWYKDGEEDGTGDNGLVVK